MGSFDDWGGVVVVDIDGVVRYKSPEGFEFQRFCVPIFYGTEKITHLGNETSMARLVEISKEVAVVVGTARMFGEEKTKVGNFSGVGDTLGIARF